MINSMFSIDEALCFPKSYRKLIEGVAECCLKLEGLAFEAEISISVIGNERMRELNAKFRGIDRSTDVLSFPMYDELPESPDGTVMLGDIVISMEKAVEQAAEYGHGIERELGFLTAHGMLHLLGYDHLTDEDEKEMFLKQESVLESLGLHKFGR